MREIFRMCRLEIRVAAIVLTAALSAGCAPLGGADHRPQRPKRRTSSGETLKGDVLSVKVFEAAMGKAGHWRPLRPISYSVFNEQGHQIEKQQFRRDGSITGRSIYKYDRAGNQIERTHFSADGAPTAKWICEYDSKGNVTKTWRGLGSELRLATQHTLRYDGEGRLTQELICDPEGNLITKRILQYDIDGHTIQGSHYRTSGEPLSKQTQAYGPNGRLRESRTEGPDGRPRARTVYTYDERGSLVDLRFYDSTGAQVGRSTCQYEYDGYGNWIKATWFDRGRPDYVATREITYEKRHNRGK